MSKQIVVCKLGWVLMGDVEETPTGYVIRNAMNIRQWGTTKGLGEIAESGPTDRTKLDSIGVAHAERDAVLFRIECAPWKKRSR